MGTHDLGGWIIDTCREEGNGIPLQYSCLENLLDRGAWQATVHKVAKSQTQLMRLCTQTMEDLVYAKSLSHIQLFETLWTVACQAPLSLGFSRQEYWSGLPFPSSGKFHIYVLIYCIGVFLSDLLHSVHIDHVPLEAMNIELSRQESVSRL